MFEGNQELPPPSYESIKTEPSAPFDEFDEEKGADEINNYSSTRSHALTRSHTSTRRNNDTSYMTTAAAISMLDSQCSEF